MGQDERNLRKCLRAAGLGAPYIDAAWPRWWTDAAEGSASARAELRFALARALGLDPKALLDDQVSFVATGGQRFKHLAAADLAERSALASFGKSVAVLLGSATRQEPAGPITAGTLREAMLSNGFMPDFRNITATCWRLGVPVVYLEVTPLDAKRMHAMATRHGRRGVILVAIRDTLLAKAAFTIAHELGHIMLGHLDGEAALVDMDDPMSSAETDAGEAEANGFALELLTGRAEPVITTSAEDYTPAQLAQAARRAGGAEGIDPGVIAMCDGFRTKDWARSTAACQMIQGRPANPAAAANNYAARQLDLDQLGEDGRSFLERVLGLADA